MWTFKKAVVYSVSTFVVLVLLFKSNANSQTPVYHPGQDVVVTITFEGPDAAKIVRTTFNFGLPGGSSSSQPGFANGMYGQPSKKIGSNTFEMSYHIPNEQAAGEYHLSQITAQFEDPTVNLIYSQPEIPNRVLKIDNSRTLTKPTVKDVQVR